MQKNKPVFIGPARQNQPYSIFFIVLLAIVLWLPGFWLNPAVPQEVHMPLYGPIERFALAWPFLSRIVALILVLAEAFLLNHIINQHQMLTKKSWLPALLFVVLAACTVEQLRLHAPLVANLFLLAAVHFLNQAYRMDKAYAYVFNAGLLIGLGSLIYFPALVFVFFALVTLLILRPFVWREWAILFIGASVPYCYAVVVFFWQGRLLDLGYEQILQPILQRDFFLKLPVKFYPLTIVIGLLLLTAVGRFVAGAGTTTLKTKKGVSVMLWLLVFAALAVLLAQDYAITGFTFALVPLAMFMSNYFLLARRTWLAEFLFFLLLGGIAAAYLNLMS